MSEDSKMGLFGSKDRNQEQKEKSSKDNSPMHYAPYCIDSDTETYDTEALSVMDINDIIGVQSGEQVGDSTLESEIAALSQIITDSKVESSQHSTDLKQEMQQSSSNILSSTSDIICPANDDNIISIVDTNELNAMTKEHTVASILETQEDTIIHTHENEVHKDSSLVVAVNSISKSVKLDSIKYSKASDVGAKDIIDDASVTCTSSSTDKPCIETDLSNAVLADTVQEVVQSKQQTNATSSMDCEEDTVEKVESKSVSDATESQDKVLKSKSDVKPVVTVGSISKSLQLIGEAYLSEDSEETSMHDSDSPKNTLLLSIGKETPSFNITMIGHDEDSSTVTKVIDTSKQNVEKSKSNDSTNMPVPDKSEIKIEESNIEIKDVINKETEDLSAKVGDPEDSSQDKTLQQDNSVLNETAESLDNKKSNNTHEQTEDSTEVGRSMTEETSSECQSSSEACAETEDASVKVSTALPKEAPQNMGENQEKSKVENIKSESNMSALISETEKQDSPMAPDGNESSDTKEKNENCSVIDNNAEDLVEDIFKNGNKNVLSELANNTLNSIPTEISDEKSCMSESLCKSSLSQEFDTAVENSQITQEAVSIETAQIDLEPAAVIGDNQDNVNSNVDANETLTLMNSTSKVASSTTKDELDVEQSTVSLIHENIEETETKATDNVQSVSSHSLNKQDCITTLQSTNSLTQNDANETDINISKDTLINVEENHTEPLVPDEPEESVEQLPPASEKSEVCEINDEIISDKPEEPPGDLTPVSDKTSNAIENLEVPLLAVEKIVEKAAEKMEDLEVKPETTFSIVREDETSSAEKTSTEEIPLPQQMLDQPELHAQNEEIDIGSVAQTKSKSPEQSVVSPKVLSENDTNLSLTDNSQVMEDDVTSSLRSTLQEENKTEGNVAVKITPNEEEAEKGEILVSSSTEEKMKDKEPIKEREEEALDINQIVESKTPVSDIQIISTSDENLQDNEEMRDEGTTILEKDSTIDVDVTSTIEEKNIEVKKSVDLKNVQSSDISPPTLQKSSERTVETHCEDTDTKSDLKDVESNSENTNGAVEMLPKMQSSKDATNPLTSMLSDDTEMTDAKCIMEIEETAEEAEANALPVAADLPLEANIEKLAEKLSQESVCIDDTIATQNIDSLERLLDLDLMPDSENPSSKNAKTKEKTPEETASKVDDMDLLLDQANQSEASLTQNSDYIANVISSCLTNRDGEEASEAVAEQPINDEILGNEATESSKMNEDVSTEPASENVDDEKMEEDPLRTEEDPFKTEEDSFRMEEDPLRIEEEDPLRTEEDPLRTEEDPLRTEDDPLKTEDNSERNDLDAEFGDNRLESVGDLEEAEGKLELPQDMLLDGVVSQENLADMPTVIENSQSSSEISELESAVKFLQESEEQTIDSPLVLSPKMVESVVEDIAKQANAELYAMPDEADNYVQAESELASRISISISEAEIISEAAKLENERKFAAQMKNIASGSDVSTEKDVEKAELVESEKVEPDKQKTENRTYSKSSGDLAPATADSPTSVPTTKNSHERKKDMPDVRSMSDECILKACDLIPRVSILEERLKEPPKIEIPVSDSTKVLESNSISPNDNLLIPKDSRAMMYSKMLESPKSDRTVEPKSVETPRKDPEKHDFENVGSPRIILKIAKSAIADCGEPRSPKSPKIRSAANSPNPEDSPGQKLGKIKLKLSKGGHPSIISNENFEEAVTGQWHTDSASSLSPIGMKIKLSKTGDASIVGATSEKHESGGLDDSKEPSKYKFEEPKRTDSPIGMKIKLSKSGDSASIVQQDTKEVLGKHKDKLEIPQDSPKRTESPIGMKIKLSKTGDASIIQSDWQENTEEHKEAALKRTDSPIGMKIKLSKTGDASIVSPSDPVADDAKTKEKQQDYTAELRTESPIGMKIKLTKGKGGAASIISVDNVEDTREKLEVPEPPKRTESPLGMKIKLSKSGDASIIHSEVSDDLKEARHREKAEAAVQDKPAEPTGIKIKVTKSGETSTSILLPDVLEEQDACSSSSSSVGVKIKMSKSGDASVVTCTGKMEQAEDSRLREAAAEAPKRTESPLGMKIKLSKTGDASIVPNEAVAAAGEDGHQTKTTRTSDAEHPVKGDSSLGMKIKLFKTGDASVVTEPAEAGRKDKQQRRNKDTTESPLEMKIKLSKTGHPTIVTCDSHETQGSSAHNKVGKESPAVGSPDSALASFSQRYADHHVAHVAHTKDSPSPLKILKASGGAGHPSILQSARSELTIEPVTPMQIQSRKAAESALEMSAKRKDITISPVDNKKSKLEAQLSQMLPEVTIQPVMCRDQQKQQQQQQQQQQQLLFDPKTSLISRQQMNVISQEISITQVRPTKAPSEAASMSDKLKDLLTKNTISSPGGSDCEIIEHRPELIIVNENSNSSQDVVIIEEVTPSRMTDIKVPKKRGRPRRNPLAQAAAQMLIPRDPLSLDEMQPVPQVEQRENERPKRTCRNQKSYAPPKRGRGRGRGKRKLDNVDISAGKKSRIDQDLSAIEASTMAVITIDETPTPEDPLRKSELYKALKQPISDIKGMNSASGKGKRESKVAEASTIALQLESTRSSCDVMQDSPKPSTSRAAMGSAMALDSKDGEQQKRPVMEIVSEKIQKTTAKQQAENKGRISSDVPRTSEIKEIPTPPGPSNWLTPTSKKQVDAGLRSGETVSTVQVIDEETRMSAESGSRSQTPARNIPAPVSETTINEESQGSVLSTATTESEKVKVKNRRMEINFDPDEGPFTVDKIAEYEWPLERKGETFMIQEQISQYLGVKSFKRKYPDLKRRMVDMEERNYLRENRLVSEAMCDMGLTAVCSSEVLDVMCSDFPDQYEEYRKHMREKQVKEHSKKQKELTAAANAERNRIDLAEMAVQSAMTWNANLNKARKENRKYCLDLQTFTIHVPKKPQKIDPEHKTSHYPVALIPGQYTDYYREYTSAELRYYPLNTVLYGPTRPNERKLDSQSEGSQSDSDSESSSDDSSSSSSEGTQDTEGSQSTMDDVDMEIVTQKDDVKLKCKMCLKILNKHNKNEILIQCGTCNGNVHPSCIDLTLDMVPHIQSYAWQCTDCKTCAQCHDPADEDKMLFCDMCDRGYHIYCVGLRRVPQGRWHCQECAVCANCGSREPGGANSDRNSVAQWQHEYKKGEKNTRVYVSTLCIPCSKLRGDQGNSV
ncbi:PREDICTED: uncharacterized protein LOC106741258 isoform X2 [Dinoponera quadriceps]|uniref:Uncharacterized protein LOC106741258 isoform X2 n=1 Tax=Dinoponera quadriceps TaxID=609295 RepID=A0A6P3WR04_DINQU|nr:PREDICTED: uncharacterized protein LOC106741258 isoform X2 [Dinoponera quadriceps]